MPKIIYHYHIATKQYLSQSEATRSPLDKEEVYLIPAHATDVAPVFEEGKITKFDIESNRWVMEEVLIAPTPTEEEKLAQAKATKIAQLKANRNASLLSPVTSVQAKEFGSNNLVYFEFETKPGVTPVTDPTTIIFGALVGAPIKYSCKILTNNLDEPLRSGYVLIDQIVATNISNFLQNIATINITRANDLEGEISAAKTLEELSAIVIEFSNS